jgi:flavin reductase (DIM6/NTAB) family NADH-FMN oxidoreductase RutF
MASTQRPDGLVRLDTDQPIWDQFFTVNPLVLIGTREEDGSIDLAPKHMAIPLSWSNYYGFVCTPRHSTYHNTKREGVFTVSYLRPNQVVLASLAATPRCGDNESKPSLAALPTFPASEVDGVFVCDGYLYLECEMEKIIDGFGDNSLITGRVVAAQVHENSLRETAQEDRDDNEIVQQSPLLAYLYPGRFATIEQTFSFPFHTGFKR